MFEKFSRAAESVVGCASLACGVHAPSLPVRSSVAFQTASLGPFADDPPTNSSPSPSAVATGGGSQSSSASAPIATRG